MQIYRYNVFGREVLVQKTSEGWSTFYPGSEGKRRSAGIHIPATVTESQLSQFLDDLCHEWATDVHPDVIRIGQDP